MEVFVGVNSKVFIITEDGGIRKPDIDEVELADKEAGSVIYFEGPITDQKISKCRCNDDEIILEMTKDDVINICTAYKASQQLYRSIIGLALTGNYKLQIKKCENLQHTYELDKIVESYMQNFENNA